MTSQTQITSVSAREILDSRGNPTVEASVELHCGAAGCASVPSGASTGRYEAVEQRDGDPERYRGKGVQNAVRSVCTEISQVLTGMDAADQYAVDRRMCHLDGTENKAKLGTNAILAVSLACARASAAAFGQSLYRYIGGISGCTLPTPYMNVLNGGAHARNSVDIQEFMLVPVSDSVRTAVRMCAEVYHALGLIVPNGGVGDEGGYAPELESDAMALDALTEAVERAGYTPGKDFTFALDAAASGWYDTDAGEYLLTKRHQRMRREELTAYWTQLCRDYPISSLEDPMGEDDWSGWQQITEALGDAVMLVGDDLFVTNAQRLALGAKRGCANAILIKPNQAGTLSETIETVKLAKTLGYGVMMSHRSGETEDTFIADLSVALNCGRIKAGAPCRTERTAKYNRLLAIEEALG